MRMQEREAADLLKEAHDFWHKYKWAKKAERKAMADGAEDLLRRMFTMVLNLRGEYLDD